MADIPFECPQCNKHLEIDSRGAGMQIECPDCGIGIIVPQPTEPPRKAQSKSSIQRSPKSGVRKKQAKSRKRVVVHGIHDTTDTHPHFNYEGAKRDGAAGILIVGWVCFVIGMVLCLLYPSPGKMFIWIPILMLAVILAGVAIGFKRTEAGITLVLMSIFMPLGGYFLAQRVDIKGAAGGLVKSTSRFDLLEFEKVEQARVEDTMVLSGRVRNKGEDPVYHITVKVDFKGEGGLLIQTRSVEVVTDQGLSPGLSRTFKVETTWDERIKDFDYTFVEK